MRALDLDLSCTLIKPSAAPNLEQAFCIGYNRNNESNLMQMPPDVFISAVVGIITSIAVGFLPSSLENFAVECAKIAENAA